jgi:hypothetical protein
MSEIVDAMMSLTPRTPAELAALRAIVGPVTAIVLEPKALDYIGGGLVVGGTVEVLPAGLQPNHRQPAKSA